MSTKRKHILESNLILEERYLIEQKSDYMVDRQSNAIMNATGIRPDKQYKEVNQIIDKAVKGASPDAPLHMKATIKFMVRDSKPLTNSDLSQENLDVLQDVLCNKSKLQKTCDSSKWTGVNKKNITNKNTLHYDDYTINYPKSPSYKNTSFSYNQPMKLRQLILTLGGSTIITSGSNWVITDVFNFDNIMEEKPYLKTDNLLGIMKNTAKGLFKTVYNALRGRSIEAGIEEILSQYHNTGYKGFKVRIVIPMGNCKCKNP